jgi:hypothetical protein
MVKEIVSKEQYDKSSILNDINERKQIIQDYQLTGHLDCDNAVKKIQALRLSDIDVAKATTARLAISSTPFSQTSDQGIVAELQMQIMILTTKYLNE